MGGLSKFLGITNKTKKKTFKQIFMNVIGKDKFSMKKIKRISGISPEDVKY